MQVASIMDAAHDDDAPRTRGGADADIAEEIEGDQDDIENDDECGGDEEDMGGICCKTNPNIST
jgi:hypothetical protein